MIGVLADYPRHESAALVLAALRRSVSHSLAVHCAPAALGHFDVALTIDPSDAAGELLAQWLVERPRKLIVFGRLPAGLKSHFGVQTCAWPEPTDAWARSPSAPSRGQSESAGRVRYLPDAASLGAAGWERALERFDFTDEWNNLAFGAIRAEGSRWSLAEAVRAPDGAELARVEVGDQALTSYAARFTLAASNVLWVNRSVGTIDSFEWRMVEHFLAHYQSDALPCVPVLSELPWGYDAAITMRLDCDEDITSARPLWLAYREMGVPLSLAIHTSNLLHDAHYPFLREFCEHGGVLMSHTATHAPNWGGSYEAAFAEGRESRNRILAATGVSVDYAVSPFHQSPHYALQGLCDAGYSGCIGGIVRNDPEFLLARGGELAGLPQGFVGHSQQTMLHGDCMLAEGDQLAIFKASFDRALETRTLFGFLDHPFSERYAYGWPDETTRIQAHCDLIAHIRGKAQAPCFMDECEALDFLRARAAISLLHNERSFAVQLPQAHAFGFGVEYRGELLPLTDEGVLK
ncbi:hypothetical protein [Uliginosibacterium sp. 31-12]|uniref:hypothetical protein n=1 Tax=Uliginosibacterium sp. 31-12 TaxID=3062781 RepID=UPI0026E3290E|nr:hypothetical protein [Uliginosibacterium sp. 31-12]MDO6388177.1 hypothetical protein [Uliginosibacterium sp. 31-12]